MDNSVYQPLSHALQQPTPVPQPSYAPQNPSASVQNTNDRDTRVDTSVRHEEEEEEEEEEVEGTVASAAVDSKQSGSTASISTATPARRRPGRPKGSKNKKPRFDVSGSTLASKQQQFSSTPQPYAYNQQTHQQPVSAPPTIQPPPSISMPPPPPSNTYPPLDPNNQALADFQWRVLTLCSEFYNAADELIRNAPQSILQQVFNLPNNHVDPMTILHDARKACDQLMANPYAAALKSSQVSQPPVGGSFSSVPAPEKSGSPSSASIISHPGSFVMSLGSSAAPAAPPAYPNYQSQRYQQPPPPTTYYSYPAQSSASGTQPYLAHQQVMKPVNLQTPAAAGNQGAWSEEETEKLRRLAEESRTAGNPDGDYDWDYVCNNWGPGRTRHQILIKATNMQLKESSTRGMKKRRETEGSGTTESSEAPGPMNGISNSSTAQAVLNAVTAAASTGASPVSNEKQSASSSPVTSVPQMSQQQQSAPTPAPPGGGSLLHWPMPHVAANTPSPVMSGGTQGSRSVYYSRDRTSKS